MPYFTYPARFTPDPDDGGFIVTFRDLLEAIAQGDTIEECLSQAADRLGESLAYRIDDNLEIPLASSLEAV
jgi:antitoxin HicB